MTMTDTSSTVVLNPRANIPGARRPGFPQALRAEWIKFWTVRSTFWSTAMLFVLGAGLTTLVCALAAEDLASGAAGESPGSFVTWGMMFAQITAIVLGALAVTSEYGTGMIRATLAATPSRGRVLAAKAVVLTGTLFVAGTVTAFAGYFAGNWFLENEGIGLSLSDDGVLRALFGSGLYLAGLGLFAAAVGLLVRHTAAASSAVSAASSPAAAAQTRVVSPAPRTNSATIDHRVDRTVQNLIHSACTVCAKRGCRRPGTFRFGSRSTVREVGVMVIGRSQREWRRGTPRCRRSGS